MVLQVAAATFFCRWLGTGDAVRATICMLVTGITELFMIGRVFPLNTWFRKVVYYGMFLLFFGILFTVPGLFDMADMGLRETIFLLAVTLLTPEILRLMELLSDRVSARMEKIAAFSRQKKAKKKAA